MSMRRKEVFTICAPIAPFVPRQLALDVLHNHGEFITLNPMVTGHRPVKAPRDAPSDEYHSAWYEITEKVQYIPGFGKMGSGDIKFNGCFHDTPWGLQTHIYAPMSVDMRAEYRIAGNQAGVEPRPAQEIGLSKIGAPSDGLYLRADIEFTSNIMLASFIRSQSKSALKEMVDRMVKKAESMDANVLRNMIHDPKPVTSSPPQRPDPLFSPPLNQSVMQQSIPIGDAERTPPAVLIPNMNSNYFTEMPDISQSAFIAELPDMNRKEIIAELPETTHRPFVTAPDAYKTPIVAELPSSEWGSPHSMYSQSPHSYTSSLTQFSVTQNVERQGSPVEHSVKRTDSPTHSTSHPQSKGYRHPNAHRKSTPKPKSSGHNQSAPVASGRRQSEHTT